MHKSALSLIAVTFAGDLYAALFPPDTADAIGVSVMSWIVTRAPPGLPLRSSSFASLAASAVAVAVALD